MPTTIWWVRRDLRLTDNQALSAARQAADQVIPLFILDPGLLNSDYLSQNRFAFLLAGLAELHDSLERRGSRLIVRRGDPLTVLQAIIRETGAEAIFAEADYSPYARTRDARIAEHLPLTLTPGLTVFPPEAVSKADGSPYTVYTPFSRAWKSLPRPAPADLLPPPAHLHTPAALQGEDIPAAPALSPHVPFPPGEAEAQRRLYQFVSAQNSPVFSYQPLRDRMDLNGTSRLSPYLRFGMISARQCAVTATEALQRAATPEAEKSAVTWLNELIWREFYVAILAHFPRVRRHNFQPKFDAFPWQNDAGHFQAWCEGRTGYPVVDAAMRQLTTTGWMHNRARMIVASFLVKHLLIDWRRGEKFFMQHLLDGDPAANNGGWQWTAGTGTDAAPYFRIFNPMLQSAKFDPNGDYIRHWLPQLANVPAEYIHAPWEMPLAAQRRAGCVIGQNYPAPIVDHKMARARALAAFEQIKGA
ncbi:MAG: deoxyribodipyrimidine photo-lyase [Anaerolineae bacterium]